MLKRYSLLLLLGAFVGCESGPSVQPVTGKVTMDDKPLASATVTFTPVVEGPGSGMPAVGSTDAQGVYKLTDLRSKTPGSGAEVGQYKVGVIWRTATGPDLSQSSGESAEGSGVANVASTAVVGESVPVPYMNPATSGLTAEVVKGDNEINFPLTKSFKGAK